MFGKRKKSFRSPRITTIIGHNTELAGDVRFNGGLHVDGTVRGNVYAAEESETVLVLSEQGKIEGEVRVPHVVLNGAVKGDVYASARLELASKARIHGNVYYSLLEMAMGAEVNGKLLHLSEMEEYDSREEGIALLEQQHSEG